VAVVHLADRGVTGERFTRMVTGIRVAVGTYPKIVDPPAVSSHVAPGELVFLESPCRDIGWPWRKPF
jgi:hypothetical protein